MTSFYRYIRWPDVFDAEWNGWEFRGVASSWSALMRWSGKGGSW